MRELARDAVLGAVDPWESEGMESLAPLEATRLRYNATSKSWCADRITILMQSVLFAEGAMRQCFRLKLVEMGSWPALVQAASSQHVVRSKHLNYVAKQYKSQSLAPTVTLSYLAGDGSADERVLDLDAVLGQPSAAIYVNDVVMQMQAKLIAEAYNALHPPRRIDFLESFVLLVPALADEPEAASIFSVERFVSGEYIKHNSNSGFVGAMDMDEHAGERTKHVHVRNTPQAFSHFSWHHSGGQLIVVDIQGVGDLLTDPQIHTLDGKGYGLGNIGLVGMAMFFRSHVCSHLCQALHLPMFQMTHDEVARMRAAMASSGETLIKDEFHRDKAWLYEREQAEADEQFCRAHPGFRAAAAHLDMSQFPTQAVTPAPPLAQVHFQVFLLYLSDFSQGKQSQSDADAAVFHAIEAARLGQADALDFFAKLSRTVADSSASLDGVELLQTAFLPPTKTDLAIKLVAYATVALAGVQLVKFVWKRRR